MRIVRAMMALLIALSVALLPTVGSAASMVHAAAQGTSEGTSMAMSADMAMPSDMSNAMDDCCPDNAKAKPGDHTRHQCPMACCVGPLTNLADAAAFRLNSPLAAGHRLPLPEDQVVSLRSGSPPFRPPRV